MKDDSENESNKAQQRIVELPNQITELTKEIAELSDPSRTCKILDVVVDGGIDYELLNGKILEIDQLKYCGNEKWLAGNNEISFDNSDFLVYPKTKLCVYEYSNLSANVFNRIVCKNLKLLHLRDVTITYYDYKKLTTSQKLDDLELRRVTVMDENSKKAEIDKLLKESKNVKTLLYSFNDGEVTSETAQKLADLPPFPNLCDLWLQNVQESFDPKIFGEFLNKNSTITFCELWYKCSGKFFEEIQRAQNDLLPTLPSTCKLDVKNFC